MIDEAPLIEASGDMIYESTICAGCGGYDTEGNPLPHLPLKRYDMRVGHNSSQSIVWCSRCAKTIALVLLQVTINE